MEPDRLPTHIATDLRRLPEFFRWGEALISEFVPEEGGQQTLLLALLHCCERHGIDPMADFGCDYRTIAHTSQGLGGLHDGHLDDGGARIRQARALLAANWGLRYWEGRRAPRRRRGTTYWSLAGVLRRLAERNHSHRCAAWVRGRDGGSAGSNKDPD